MRASVNKGIFSVALGLEFFDFEGEIVVIPFLYIITLIWHQFKFTLSMLFTEIRIRFVMNK